MWSEPADGLYITLSRIGNLSSVARRRREHLTPEDRSELHAALSFIAVALENAPSLMGASVEVLIYTLRHLKLEGRRVTSYLHSLYLCA